MMASMFHGSLMFHLLCAKEYDMCKWAVMETFMHIQRLLHIRMSWVLHSRVLLVRSNKRLTYSCCLLDAYASQINGKAIFEVVLGYLWVVVFPRHPIIFYILLACIAKHGQSWNTKMWTLHYLSEVIVQISQNL